MRQFDRPAKPGTPDINRYGDLGRFSDPTTLVCAALALAVVVLAMRIVSFW
jgi:hypothetical protein